MTGEMRLDLTCDVHLDGGGSAFLEVRIYSERGVGHNIPISLSRSYIWFLGIYAISCVKCM